MTDVLYLYGAENATVPVESEPDARCPPIAGDAQQLRQVKNAAANAQDATEQARGEGPALPPVRITTRWSESTRRVRLTSDSGPGFPAHILQRAFEPYVTTKPRGTGLGLAVVKKIADEHGARIELSNRLDDGVVRGAQVSLSFATLPIGGVITTPPQHPRRFIHMANILVVDDELGIRDLLSEILNDEGHSVDLAENATQARAARAAGMYDLVLLDIWMPDTDGVSLLKEWASAWLRSPCPSS